MSAKRRRITKNKRRRVYTRDGFKCVSCPFTQEDYEFGREYSRGQGNFLTLEHIVPYSLGGPDDDDNLATMCYDCNNAGASNVQMKSDPTFGKKSSRKKMERKAIKMAIRLGYLAPAERRDYVYLESTDSRG